MNIKYISLAIICTLVLLPMATHAEKKENNQFIKCVDKQDEKDIGACLTKVGRIEWYPYNGPVDCSVTSDILNRADNSGWKLSWKLLFMNERCRRFGMDYYER